MKQHKHDHIQNGSNQKTYFCIDLKSFYASVECVDRGLDPLRTNLVVADPERTDHSVCLAITPPMKTIGIKNRCRLRDIPSHVRYTVALPRMRRYMEVSTHIYSLYLRYFSPEDIYLYSIDECFIDATSYLKLYKTQEIDLAQKILKEVLEQTGISATIGIGTNLFLAKVALDITAKHSPDGVGILDENIFRHTYWFHTPITDFWQIGLGIARRLARLGIYNLGGIVAASPQKLYKEFGQNAEYLIDHAWGQEPCTIDDIHSYKPKSHSSSHSQILPSNYTFDEARTVVYEMADASVLELIAKEKVCSHVFLSVRYAPTPAEVPTYRHTGGTKKLGYFTNSAQTLIEKVLELYDTTTHTTAPIRRISVGFGELEPDTSFTPSLFDDEEQLAKEHTVLKTINNIKDKYGKNSLIKAISLNKKATARERNKQIGGHRAG
ncbi:DNA repair protein [Corynebacterium sp. sy039]|uniref:Y-family DNA polymerase n=1 Tax=Corynebacterium sp. sy039 TaxID=2599641 RepID=UPI0011B58E89|nr:DNA repair protein [Corynebacterium sp. sy039]QDZ42474.1 DNA repair protein [Corynebacterium sp. sy039]